MRAVEVDKKVETFDRHRGRLFGISYRMLGSRTDAEDVLQEAYIRWHTADAGDIENVEAWLVTVVTRLSIDRLRKASATRETYIGPWLPEPILTEPSPQDKIEFASNLSIAFMTILERLSPTERAVFLLHDVFDYAYGEIARITGKSEPAVRQITSRARTRVRSDNPRFQTDPLEHRRLVEKFAVAAYAADEQALLDMFSPEITVVSDGGGKITAARKAVRGLGRVMRVFTIALARIKDHVTNEIVEINGEPGIIEYYDGIPFAATTMMIENDRISAVYRVMNPEKLRAFEK
jgi:RNA polymerase sigma-70 factor (ECF subfamily)